MRARELYFFLLLLIAVIVNGSCQSNDLKNQLENFSGSKIVFPYDKLDFRLCSFYTDTTASNPRPIGFSGILLAKRQNSFYCTYFLHNRNVADTKSPYPIKRLEVIRWFNQKSMVFNQSLS